MIQELLGEFLSNDGHTYKIASDGREGIGKFKAGSFDLVITDRAMLDIGGDQFASMVKHYSPITPVIMITGFGSIVMGNEFVGIR
ncbi:MAG: hypothetical protein QG641_2702 [Candidatus Poribacteria bacterium]|nr:hypothetical protein [Candidatus Poribacteria bacterium]